MTVSAPTESTISADSKVSLKDALRKRTRPSEVLIEGFLFFCGAVSILTTIGIVYVLLQEAVLFFNIVSFQEFFLATEWQPAIGKFGIWALSQPPSKSALLP